MTSRKPFVGGNWKMNLHGAEAQNLATQLTESLPTTDKVDIAIFPAFGYLAQVGKIIEGSSIKLGAQDFYHQPNGAFTGEVSLSMLTDLGVSVVLIGHSERRHVIGETDSLVNDKVLAALEANMQVILCVGETLEQREAGKTDAINMGQTLLGLAGVKAEQMAQVTLAYEPVWAIGTGKTATPADAQSAHLHIRQALAQSLFNQKIADAVRIQYGGSMKPGNASELCGEPDIDGGLIGGAALQAADFAAICETAASQ